MSKSDFTRHMANRVQTWEASREVTRMALSPSDAFDWVEKAYDAGRADALKEAWDCVNGMIQFGHIGGNGCDPSAQRNGLVLATNAIMALRHPQPDNSSDPT